MMGMGIISSVEDASDRKASSADIFFRKFTIEDTPHFINSLFTYQPMIRVAYSFDKEAW